MEIMWYEVENGSLDKPADVDTISSKVYVYVRRNFEVVQEVPDDDCPMPAHYKWEEMKIPKEAWGIAQQARANSAGLEDVYGALMELAELL